MLHNICYKEQLESKCFLCVRVFFPSPPRDVRRIGVELIGHQRRITSSVQTLRLQLLHEQEQGFHV